VTVSAQGDTPRVWQPFLRRTTRGYCVALLGACGEPAAGLPVGVQLHYAGVALPAAPTHALTTDVHGCVHLGELPGVTAVTVTAPPYAPSYDGDPVPPVSATLALPTPAAVTFPPTVVATTALGDDDLHVQAAVPFVLPPGTAPAAWRPWRDVRLREGHPTSRLPLRDMLTRGRTPVTPDAAGEYELVIKRPDGGLRLHNAAYPTSPLALTVVPARHARVVTRCLVTSDGALPCDVAAAVVDSGGRGVAVSPRAPLRLARVEVTPPLPGLILPHDGGVVAGDLCITVVGGGHGPGPATSADVRMRVSVTTFVPPASPNLDALVGLPITTTRRPMHAPPCTYGRAVAQPSEVRYVHSRRAAVAADGAPLGIMLPQPSLLVHPASLGALLPPDPPAAPAPTTERSGRTTTDAAQQPTVASQLFAQRAPVATPPAPTAGAAGVEALARGSRNYAEGAVYDCVGRPAVVFENLVPDADGCVRIPARALWPLLTPPGAAHAPLGDVCVTAVATDGIAAASTTVPVSPAAILLPPAPGAAAPTIYDVGAVFPPCRSLALPATALPPADVHVVQQSRATVLRHAGERVVLAASATNTRVEVYGGLERVAALYATNSAAAPLADDWSWLARWGSLSSVERAARYSKYACHELHLFLFFHDHAFFTAVVAPYLACKRAKTFIDHWLLGDDLTRYAAAPAVDALNDLEKALLAAYLAAAAPDAAAAAAIARRVRDAAAAAPLSPSTREAIFLAALDSGDLDGASAGLASALHAASVSKFLSMVHCIRPSTTAPTGVVGDDDAHGAAADKPAAKPAPAVDFLVATAQAGRGWMPLPGGSNTIGCDWTPEQRAERASILGIDGGRKYMRSSSKEVAPASIRGMRYNRRADADGDKGGGGGGGRGGHHTRASATGGKWLGGDAGEGVEEDGIVSPSTGKTTSTEAYMALGDPAALDARVAADDLRRREAGVRGVAYVPLNKTETFAEAQYWHVGDAATARLIITATEFWADFADHCLVVGATARAALSHTGASAHGGGGGGGGRNAALPAALYAAAAATPFLSPAFAAVRSKHVPTSVPATYALNECLAALAVLGLPFERATPPAVAADPPAVAAVPGRGEVCYTAGATPAVVFHQDLPRAVDGPPSSVLVGSMYFDAGADRPVVAGRRAPRRYLPSRPASAGGPRAVTVRVGSLVGVHTVVTNMGAAAVTVDVLHHIPAGTVAVGGRGGIVSRSLTLEPFSTGKLKYTFYAPTAGVHVHYPVQVSVGAALVAYGPPAVVVATSGSDGGGGGDGDGGMRSASWARLARDGTVDELVDAIAAANVHATPWDALAPRCRDARTHAALQAALRARHAYVPSVWAFNLLHGDAAGVREYLGLPDALAALVTAVPALATAPGGLPAAIAAARVDAATWLDSVGGAAAHTEFSPVVVARAHCFGGGRAAPLPPLHPAIVRAYRGLLGRLATTGSRAIPADDLLAVVYHLLLQNRVPAAARLFARVPRPLGSRLASGSGGSGGGGSSASAVQYDYLAAYLDVAGGDGLYSVARAAAAAYADFPVTHWAALFTALRTLLDDVTGDGGGGGVGGTTPGVAPPGPGADAAAREAAAAAGAAREPTLSVTATRGTVTVTAAGVATLALRLYAMDVEAGFSVAPFSLGAGAGAGGSLGRFAYLRPNYATSPAVPPCADGAGGRRAGELCVPLPAAFARTNVMVEVVATPAPGYGGGGGGGGGAPGDVRGVSSRALRAVTPHYASDMAVVVTEAAGRLKVTASGGAPLPRTYVKVYSRRAGGSTAFYKDGYTDLRGVFDYAALSTDDLAAATPLAILVHSDSHRPFVTDVPPPRGPGVE